MQNKRTKSKKQNKQSTIRIKLEQANQGTQKKKKNLKQPQYTILLPRMHARHSPRTRQILKHNLYTRGPIYM